MKTSRYCSLCNEKVSVSSKNKLQCMSRDAVLNLKSHIHYKKHNQQFLTTKGLTKSVSVCVVAWVLALIVFPIWIATYPFWWIHEKIG